MLQCSNYKTWIQTTERMAFEGAISPAFYQMPGQNAAAVHLSRYQSMEHLAGAPYLRNLLSLAVKLRELANESLCRGDQALYLMTADALEKRAEWLAASLPTENAERQCDPKLHKPVDVTI